ncbi:hypothetical protein V0R50_28595 [Pseudomonas sp. 148P]|uniref:Uncharacterized protein n=1 Tax=Pseudomonas ulcerans TaxID=3115852 RepID=A0ABU7I083_9PSED|nr:MULTISPECIES: hypothetical protein [unclassified Pseudomonas]MEE1925958.1 hypothetical protein [Pseudomonas sp. 147P]MEE1937202.1 hypothetical protein [Pseudomonas sp. 148P]
MLGEHLANFEIGLWIGFWIAIVWICKQKGKGGVFRHLAGCIGGFALTVALVVVLQSLGVLPPNPKTFDLTPEQYAARLNPLLREWEHHPWVDPNTIIEGKEYDVLETSLDPYTTAYAAISKSNGKIYRVFVKGEFGNDMNAFTHMTRLSSAALAATQKNAITDDVYNQMSKLADGETVLLGDASITFELQKGVGMKYYADPR